jgi:hypothetical protein
MKKKTDFVKGKLYKMERRDYNRMFYFGIYLYGEIGEESDDSPYFLFEDGLIDRLQYPKIWKFTEIV